MKLWLLLMAPWVVFLPAATAAVLPPNALLLNSDPDSFRLIGQLDGAAEAKIVPVQGQGFDRAWRVEVRHQPQAEYQVQLVAAVGGKLNRGDSILLSVWARAAASAGPDGEGRIGLVVEQGGEPYDKALTRRFNLGPSWQRLDVAARITEDFGRTRAHVALRVGYFQQTIEIGGVELRRFDSSVALSDLPQTPLTYRGREAGAVWRRQAEERIESLRKSALTVRVTDAAGRPVSGADIQVRMLRHAFAFGCAYNDARFPPGIVESSDDRIYQQHFAQLFNTAVDESGMKWPSWQNPATREAAIRALEWMRDHGIAVRGHCLVWPGWRHLPPDLRALANDPPALERRIDDHIREMVGALSGKISEWDVVNEPYLNNDLMHVLGDGAMANWFKLARQADPSARLYLNEADVPDSPLGDRRYSALYDRVQSLKQEGAPISGIGMQAHFGEDLTPPTDLLAIYDRFADLGIPIRITEFDIDTADEQLQADYFRDFLTASFSDPEINGIVLWGFWEGQDWRPDAALFRKNWSIKPNGQVWEDLVMKKWWTNLHGTSAVDGTYSTRGFLGDYLLSAKSGQRCGTIEISLPREGGVANISIR